MTGCAYKVCGWNFGNAFHVVNRLDNLNCKKMEVFAGEPLNGDIKRKVNNAKSLSLPTSVYINKNNRVPYNSDYGNNQILVLNEKAKVLKSIPLRKPTKITIDQKTQELF